MKIPSLHSIRPLDDDETGPRGWRIASAIMPVALADLTVSSLEEHKLLPGRALLLQTVRMLEEESGYARLDEVARITGIGNVQLMARILVSLVEEGLVIIDQNQVRQNPNLTQEGEIVRILIHRKKQVCIVGPTHVPVREVDTAIFKSLKGRVYATDSTWGEVPEAILEEWRKNHWDSNTQRLEIHAPLKPFEYIMEVPSWNENKIYFSDGRNKAHVKLRDDHALTQELGKLAQPIRERVIELLQPFGTFDATRYELECSAEQWEAWTSRRGRMCSEVIFRGSIDVGMTVFCVPKDGEAARAMLLDLVLSELEANPTICDYAGVNEMLKAGRSRVRFATHEFETPSFAEVEAVAWEKGRWELAYEMARSADGL